MAFFDCTVIGDITLDVAVRIAGDHERFFKGGTSYCNNAQIVLGGSANVAIGISALGGKTAFIGKAGNDFSGRFYEERLKDKAVFSQVFFDEHCPTGLIVVFVENARKRSFLVYRGANDKLSKDEVDKASELIRKSNYLYFSGYSLLNDPQRSAILHAVDLAKKFKKKIVFDPGAFNLIKSERKLFTKLLQFSDIFSPNLEEARALTNIACIDDMIDKLRESIPLTALKCDQNGCILISKEKVLRVPRMKVKSVDPTGAGDAFTAGLIFGLSRELPLESTGQLANWLASQVITRVGAGSFPAKSKIEHFLRRLSTQGT
jgi:sugar/nucleoside kinase (ribokinase family)